MLTLANLITLFRIVVLVPAFVVSFFYMSDHPRMPWAVFGIFTLAAVLDGVDGVVARALKQQSRLGAFLDPLADKLLVTLVFILGVRYGIPVYVTVLVVSRDLMIVLGWTALRVFEQNEDIRPIWLSKLNTVCQFLTAIIFLLNIAAGDQAWSPIVKIMLHLTVGTTVISGIAYVCVWYKRMGGFTRAQ